MTSSSSTSPPESHLELAARAAPQRLPPSFARFDTEPDQLRAGAPGKVGLLELHFEARGDRTDLCGQYASGPQRVQRALRLDPEMPAMAYTFIQSVSGGILQGDRLAMEITIGRSAMAHVTTQSAIKVYRMERNHSSQRVSVRVEEGAYFELLPDYLIPYRGARLYQEVDLQVAADATMLFWDAVVPGRVSSGEAFAYELLHTRIEASDLDGRLRFTDNVVLEPGRQDPRRPGLLGDHPALGTFYVLTTLISGANLAEHFDQAIGGLEGVEASASQLPRGDGAVVRVVAADSLAVQAALYRAWREARQAILGVGIPRLHTIKYGDEPVSQRGGNR